MQVRIILLAGALLLASCATPKAGLMEAGVAQKGDVRDRLERNIAAGDLSKFVYFDRAKAKLYSLGVAVAGFDFHAVDMDRLKSENRAVFDIAQCAAGKSCAAPDDERCVLSAPLAANPDQARQGAIVKKLKSRGYPVVGVTFSQDSAETSEIEVRYFTECEWIRRDLEANFPGLLSAPGP